MTFEIDGRWFAFQPAPHLRTGDDWHDAYGALIARFLAKEGSRDHPTPLPAYPLASLLPRQELLFEMGAYWEGALRFLAERLGAPDPLSGLEAQCFAHTQGRAEFRGRLFMTVWNSQGQLKWLKAHCIRTDALKRGELDPLDGETPRRIRAAARTHRNRSLAWLASFVEQHADEGATFPNPYFGGTNPLHLGGWTAE